MVVIIHYAAFVALWSWLGRKDCKKIKRKEFLGKGGLIVARKQSAELERKKFFSDPILVSMIVVLLVFLALFILYPLLMLLVDSFYSEGKITLEVFGRVLSLERFQKAFKNTLVLGMITGIASTAIGLLFAYVEVYVKLKTKVLEKLFAMVSMLPVVSPPFVLSLSMIMLFGRSGIITRSLLGIYDSNVYGLRESPLCRR